MAKGEEKCGVGKLALGMQWGGAAEKRNRKVVEELRLKAHSRAAAFCIMGESLS
jgi:hypothetical protein